MDRLGVDYSAQCPFLWVATLWVENLLETARRVSLLTKMRQTDHTLADLEARSQTVAARIADNEIEASRDRLFTMIESQESKVKETKQQLRILLLAEASQRVSPGYLGGEQGLTSSGD